MARKRQTQRKAKENSENQQAVCGDDDKVALSFTLDQALAELDRLTPWTRSLPICKALLQNEINRLRASDGSNNTDADKPPVAEVPPVAPCSGSSTATISSIAATVKESETSDEQQDDHAIDAMASLQALEPDSGSLDPVFSDQADKKAIECAYLDGSSIEPLANEDAAESNFEKAQLKIRIPVEEYPGYNFVGRLLGPRGATLKQLELSSKCRLYIRGRGSLRSSDAHELAKSSLPGFEHLNEDLHVLVEYEGDSKSRDACLSVAASLLEPLMVPPISDEQDELKKQQLKDLAILNGTYKENKQLLPVCNRRVAPGSHPLDTGSTCSGPGTAIGNGHANNMSANLNDLKINGQRELAAGGHAGGMGPNAMQVMAQQIFMQEQLSMKMRMGIQQAQQVQQAMALRQQSMSTITSIHNKASNKQPPPSFNTYNTCSQNSASNNINSFANNRGMLNSMGLNNNNGASGLNTNNTSSSGMGALGCGNMRDLSMRPPAPTNQMNNQLNTHMSNPATSNKRPGQVSVDARPFVPPMARSMLDMQPFFPRTNLSQQPNQRGRSNCQGSPQQRSFSQGPPTHQHDINKGYTLSARDENQDPQQWCNTRDIRGLSKVPSSPSFLTSMFSCQKSAHNMQFAGFHNMHGEFSRSESDCLQGLDDSVDRGWGNALNFDLASEGCDADSSVNTSITNKTRTSPPGGRGAHRFNPYSRSPPKASPDFNSKVLALCTASFGPPGPRSGNQGAYKLF